MRDRILLIYLLLCDGKFNKIYFIHYCRFIYSRVQIEKKKFRTAVHHILPVSLAKSLGILPAIYDSPFNKITLTHEDHLIAHLLLWKTIDCISTRLALMYMSNTINNTEKFHIKSAKFLSFNTFPHTGMERSAEWRRKISESLKGKKLSPERVAKSVTTYRSKYRHHDEKFKSLMRNLYTGRTRITEDGRKRLSDLRKANGISDSQRCTMNESRRITLFNRCLPAQQVETGLILPFWDGRFNFGFDKTGIRRSIQTGKPYKGFHWVQMTKKQRDKAVAEGRWSVGIMYSRKSYD
jgi:hypothetical protein